MPKKKRSQQFWPLIILTGGVAIAVMLLAVVNSGGVKDIEVGGQLKAGAVSCRSATNTIAAEEITTSVTNRSCTKAFRLAKIAGRNKISCGGGANSAEGVAKTQLECERPDKCEEVEGGVDCGQPLNISCRKTGQVIESPRPNQRCKVTVACTANCACVKQCQPISDDPTTPSVSPSQPPSACSSKRGNFGDTCVRQLNLDDLWEANAWRDTMISECTTELNAGSCVEAKSNASGSQLRCDSNCVKDGPVSCEQNAGTSCSSNLEADIDGGFDVTVACSTQCDCTQQCKPEF